MSTQLTLKIKDLISKNNLSVQGLEKKAGLKINAVRNILTGHSKRPSAETLLAVAGALNCRIGELLGEPLPKAKNIPEFKKMSFSNHKLMNEITTYVIEQHAKREIEIASEDFISFIQEIYTYSNDHNKGVLDENFATWLLKKKFD